MKIIKKLFLFVFVISIFQMNLNATEIGSKHEYGISLLGSYEYEERKFMHLRSGSQAEKDQLVVILAKVGTQDIHSTWEHLRRQ